MTPDPTTAPSRAGLAGTIALLAAPALLAWPLPRVVSGFDPLPLITGAGWATLSGLAAVVVIALSITRLPVGALLAVLPAIALVAGHFLGDQVPALENSAPLFTLGSGLAVFVAASCLDRGERHTLVKGLTIVSLLYTVPALLEAAVGASSVGLAGTLQNVGSTNQAALPGAIAGAWIGICRRGAWRWIGFTALGAFAVHAAVSPVIAGGLAAAAALVAAALGSPWCQEIRRMRGAFGSAAAMFVFVAMLSAFPHNDDSRADVGSGGPGVVLAVADIDPVEDATAPDDDLGGVGVRLRIWGALPAMVADAGPFGFGPGGFQRSFPPYRDPAEARASELNGELGAATEVEHAHNDWFEGFVELGWFGGLAWFAFLAACLAAACASITERAFGRAACAACGIAVLVNAAMHSNLIANPAASLQAMAVFGVVAGTRWGAPLGRGRARLVALAPVVVALAAPLAPWRLVTHGNALARSVRANLTLAQGGLGESEAAATRARATQALDAALVASGRTSSTALELALIDARRAGDSQLVAVLGERLHAVRPFSANAHTQRGLAAIAIGDLRAARIAFQEAAALRPHDPACAFNEVRVTLQSGLATAALDAARAAVARGALDSERVSALARDAQLGGWVGPQTARELLELAGKPLTPDDLIERADKLRDQSGTTPTVAALESMAQHLWGREHAQVGNYGIAVRSYRQAWRASCDAGQPGSPLLRLELAAAERLSGNPERAEVLLEASVPEGQVTLDLPHWAVGALAN
ncbi:hypothetical protein [Engelhardtia mirabilis]|uniref:O-Antigen ligase n=1 Tax=Engelhardtia mirabilis TaxID=2528011 RepID=A0A518BPZ5_9BACT|nr:O-Antigen ligase [Planctomycetes bacterium Pla133]QDV03370.1 O-Antigen ligase [Planctomycetes bacterium Pla86]